MPEDSIGMLEIVESTATQLPTVRANRLQLVRSTPLAECPPTATGGDSGVLSSRTPSTRGSGSLESEIEFEPRMRTRVPAPLSPEEDSTTTPGARELSASEKVLTAAVVICDASMLEVDA